MFAADHRPIVEELSQLVVGGLKTLLDVFKVSPYPRGMVEVLLRHLKGNYHVRTREMVARALAVKAAHSFMKEIVIAFEESDDKDCYGVKWALGCTIASIATMGDWGVKERF